MRSCYFINVTFVCGIGETAKLSSLSTKENMDVNQSSSEGEPMSPDGTQIGSSAQTFHSNHLKDVGHANLS